MSGTVEVDFVVVTKPTAEAVPLSDEDFKILRKRQLIPCEDDEGQIIRIMRGKSDVCYFTCRQVTRSSASQLHSSIAPQILRSPDPRILMLLYLLSGEEGTEAPY